MLSFFPPPHTHTLFSLFSTFCFLFYFTRENDCRSKRRRRRENYEGGRRERGILCRTSHKGGRKKRRKKGKYFDVFDVSISKISPPLPSSHGINDEDRLKTFFLRSGGKGKNLIYLAGAATEACWEEERRRNATSFPDATGGKEFQKRRRKSDFPPPDSDLSVSIPLG